MAGCVGFTQFAEFLNSELRGLEASILRRARELQEIEQHEFKDRQERERADRVGRLLPVETQEPRLEFCRAVHRERGMSSAGSARLSGRLSHFPDAASSVFSQAELAYEKSSAFSHSELAQQVTQPFPPDEVSDSNEGVEEQALSDVSEWAAKVMQDEEAAPHRENGWQLQPEATHFAAPPPAPLGTAGRRFEEAQRARPGFTFLEGLCDQPSRCGWAAPVALPTMEDNAKRVSGCRGLCVSLGSASPSSSAQSTWAPRSMWPSLKCGGSRLGAWPLALAVLADAVVLGLSVEFARDSRLWVAADSLIAAFFLSELILQMQSLGIAVYFLGEAFGRGIARDAELRWRLIEVVLVAAAWLEISLAIVADSSSSPMLRALRLGRMCRLLRVCRLWPFADLAVVFDGAIGVQLPPEVPVPARGASAFRVCARQRVDRGDRQGLDVEVDVCRSTT